MGRFSRHLRTQVRLPPSTDGLSGLFLATLNVLRHLPRLGLLPSATLSLPQLTPRQCCCIPPPPSLGTNLFLVYQRHMRPINQRQVAPPASSDPIGRELSLVHWITYPLSDMCHGAAQAQLRRSLLIMSVGRVAFLHDEARVARREWDRAH